MGKRSRIQISRVDVRAGEWNEAVEFFLLLDGDKIGVSYFAQKSGDDWLAWENHMTAPAVLTYWKGDNKDKAVEYCLERATVMQRTIERVLAKIG